MKAIRMSTEQYDAHQARVKGTTVPIVEAPKPAKKKVDYARMLAQQIRKAKLPEPILEYPFDSQLEGSGRAWRFDLCWPSWLAVEVDGAVHRIRERFNADIPKHQAAFALGYKLLRVSPEQVRNGEALALVRKALT